MAMTETRQTQKIEMVARLIAETGCPRRLVWTVLKKTRFDYDDALEILREVESLRLRMEERYRHSSGMFIIPKSLVVRGDACASP